MSMTESEKKFGAEMFQFFKELGNSEFWKKVTAGENVNHKFNMNGNLDDGTPVMIEGDLNVGAKVSVEDETGVAAPIKDGEYIVKVGEDQIKIKVVGGLITETPEMAAGTPPEETEQQKNNMEERLKAIEAKLAEIETKSATPADTAQKLEETSNELKNITVKMSKEIEDLKAKNATLETQNTELINDGKKLFAKIDEVLNSPAGKSLFSSDEDKNKEKKNADAMSEFRRKNGLI